jgi:flagellar FliJ protein
MITLTDSASPFMSSLNALLVAISVATRQRDDARKALQATLAAQQAARAQLEQLNDYARETEARWGMRSDAEMKPEVMYHHVQFMGRLGHAAGLQTTVVGDHEDRVNMARQTLLQAEIRLASLSKVVDRRRSEIELTNARREQKQTDERASLRYRNSQQEH